MTEQLKAAALPMHVFHRDGQDLFTADQMRAYAADALRAALAAPAVPTEPVAADQARWCKYVAGMIGGYLGIDDEDARTRAIAGIIERRLWSLAPAAPQPASEPQPADHFVDADKLVPVRADGGEA